MTTSKLKVAPGPCIWQRKPDVQDCVKSSPSMWALYQSDGGEDQCSRHWWCSRCQFFLVWNPYIIFFTKWNFLYMVTYLMRTPTLKVVHACGPGINQTEKKINVQDHVKESPPMWALYLSYRGEDWRSRHHVKNRLCIWAFQACAERGQLPRTLSFIN